MFAPTLVLAASLCAILTVAAAEVETDFVPPNNILSSNARLEQNAEDLVLVKHQAHNKTDAGMLSYFYQELLRDDDACDGSAGFGCRQTTDASRAGVGAVDTLDPKRKGKWCMKNLTKCMVENGDYMDSLHSLSSVLFRSTPPIDLTEVHGVTERCKQANRRYLNNLYSYQLWAMRMYDSTAKLPPGILSGNINNFGDFDLCMKVKVDSTFHTHEAEDISSRSLYGKYCLAAIQVKTPSNAYLAAIHNLVHAHNAFVSQLNDPGHRVPKFSSIHWGFCIPDECSARDLELGLKETAARLFKNTSLEYKLEVNSNMCTSSEPTGFHTSFYIASGFFLMVFLFALAATVYDLQETNTNNKSINDRVYNRIKIFHIPLSGLVDKWILAFSLNRNIRSMIDMRRNDNDLDAVHGIRFMNAMMLLLAHKSMALLFLPYTNRAEMSEIIGQPWTVLGRAASLYTDPFIMISGTLTAYSLLGRLQKGARLNLAHEYISRLFRIVPTLAALIAFCTFVLPQLGAGPLWNQVVGHHSEICRKYWWRNLVFIHNYYGFEEMCLTHTHHVGIDTQLFFASPFFILMIWKWPKTGSLFLFGLAIVSTIMRYYVTLTRHLSNYVHFGTSIQQLFDTADYMYILPAHRLTVYIMGIILAHVLRCYKHIALRSIYLYIGNTLAIIAFLVAFCGAAFMGHIDYVYNPSDAAWYAAFAPVLWCFAFAWLIFTTQIGRNGAANRLASLPAFKAWTRISYTVYLTQFPIFFYNVGTTKHSSQYNFISKNVNLLELISILAISASLTLLFETPFQNIKNLLFSNARPAKSKSDFKENDKQF